MCADPMPPVSIGQTANEIGARLFQVNRDYSVEQKADGISWRFDNDIIPDAWRRIEQIDLPLAGEYQVRNLAGVMAVLALTNQSTGVTPDHLRAGLQEVSLPGRCQVISHQPELIVDVAHNRQSAAELARFLSSRPLPDAKKSKTIVVLGVLADKALEEIVGEVLASVDRWHLATLSGERGQQAGELLQKIEKVRDAVSPGSQLDAQIHDSPTEAYDAAMDVASSHDRVVVFGSFFTVGDIMDHAQIPDS